MRPARAENGDGASAAGGGARLRPETWLYAARAVRDFGDGFVAILLPACLLALGYDPLAATPQRLWPPVVVYPDAIMHFSRLSHVRLTRR